MPKYKKKKITSLVFEESQGGTPLLDNVYVIFFVFPYLLCILFEGFLGLGEGPKRTLKIVHYESRPLPSESRLGPRLNWKLGSNRPTQELIEQILDLTFDFQ